MIGAYSTQVEEENLGDGSGGRILVYCDSYLIDMKPSQQPIHESVGLDPEKILLGSFLDYLIHGLSPTRVFPMSHLRSQSFEESRLMLSASSRQRIDEDLLTQERKVRYRDFLR